MTILPLPGDELEYDMLEVVGKLLAPTYFSKTEEDMIHYGDKRITIDTVYTYDKSAEHLLQQVQLFSQALKKQYPKLTQGAYVSVDSKDKSIDAPDGYNMTYPAEGNEDKSEERLRVVLDKRYGEGTYTLTELESITIDEKWEVRLHDFPDIPLHYTIESVEGGLFTQVKKKIVHNQYDDLCEYMTENFTLFKPYYPLEDESRRVDLQRDEDTRGFLLYAI